MDISHPNCDVVDKLILFELWGVFHFRYLMECIPLRCRVWSYIPRPYSHIRYTHLYWNRSNASHFAPAIFNSHWDTSYQILDFECEDDVGVFFGITRTKFGNFRFGTIRKLRISLIVRLTRKDLALYAVEFWLVVYPQSVFVL